jgi:O-antigen/teichoic acid export membrane protein
MTNTQRVIFNTAALYVRMGITTVLSLFASRFVLAALGVVDYGLYSVIAGIMGFMGFLNGAMATSSQRQLTCELGRGDLVQVNRVFNTCLFLHAFLAVLLVILGETVGLWFLNHVLNIPDARREAAFMVYQFTILSAASYVILVPYQALMTAHEALALASLVAIIQSVLSFLLALFICHASGDRLILYMGISCAIVVLITAAQAVLCRAFFSESRLNKNGIDRRLVPEILSISGWSLFGAFSAVGRFQGIAFVLNVFFGPAVNAAYGIANQVNAAVSQFSQTMMGAVTPRLMKHEGAGNRGRMLELSLLSCKYVFFLASLAIIPLFAELPMVLTLWLKHPPEHALWFCRIALLVFLADQLSLGLANVVLATGRMAYYQIIIGMIHIATLPLAYLLLKLGLPAETALLCSLFTMLVAVFSRGLVVQKIVYLPYRRWLQVVVIRGAAAILPAVAVACGVLLFIPPSLVRFLVLTPLLGFATLAGIYFIGMTREERQIMREQCFSITSKKLA